MEFKTASNSRPIELHEAEKIFLVLQNVSNKNSWRRLRFKVYFDTTYMCIQCKLKILKNIPPPNMGVCNDLVQNPKCRAACLGGFENPISDFKLTSMLQTQPMYIIFLEDQGNLS